MIENTFAKKTGLKAAIIATDTSKKEFKSVSSLERLQKIGKQKKVPILYTKPVIHSLSKFKSILGTTKAFSFFLDPKKSGVSYRRDFCISCKVCKT